MQPKYLATNITTNIYLLIWKADEAATLLINTEGTKISESLILDVLSNHLRRNNQNTLSQQAMALLAYPHHLLNHRRSFRTRLTD